MANVDHAEHIVGIDVSKAELVIEDGIALRCIDNNARSIKAWLRSMPGPMWIAIESTGTFHRQCVELAHAAGHRLYLIDGFRLERYRDSVSIRAKTDPADASLLRRYLMREHPDLRPWTPPPASYDSLHRLLGRRAKLVKVRTQLRQSLAGLPEIGHAADDLMARLGRLIEVFDKRIERTADQAQLPTAAARQVEGVGPLTATALANAYQRGQFANSDAYIAFLGMDVRVRDSGASRGRRKLSKKGDPEYRRLLYNAAMGAVRTDTFRPLYEGYLARGLTKIQSLVIIARKLARIAFALIRSGEIYRPSQPKRACVGT